jgi:hypothetical protein
MFSIAFNLWAGPSGTIDMIRGYSNGTPLDSTFTPTPAARFHSFSLLPQQNTIVCNKIFCWPRASEPIGFDLGPSSDTLPLGLILGDAFGELPAAYKTSYSRCEAIIIWNMPFLWLTSKAGDTLQKVHRFLLILKFCHNQ